MNFKLILCLVPLLATPLFGQRTPSAPELISVKKLWSEGQHNAFTDLIRFKDAWFCTFRESEAHVGGDGKIRVLMSIDGERWGLAGTLSEAGVDLRDPKFSITPDNRLMLVLGGSIYEGKTLKGKRPRVSFSKDGKQWSAPQPVMEEDDWLWRVTWHEGRAYGIAYTVPTKKTAASAPGEWTAKFVSSDDGIHYRTIKQLEVPGRPNEATVRFLTNGDCVALLRREGLGAKSERAAWIGTSRAPYEEWKWKPAGLFVGGPNFIVLPNGEMIVSGREHKLAPDGPKTFVGRMDQNSVTPQLILPSSGDCSYPGLVWHEGMLWVSYYSSHEGKSSIYLAKVKAP
ncbi:MAG TPA: sialidase family protein [Candidatus Limnocylindria bacterium]|nr:sialidase family protein [Candidatus Limnocylindria bacterium]